MNEKIEELQKLIDESNNIVFFGGAGVSTESGIKDFRGKDGLYKTSKEDNPEYLLSYGCLCKDTQKFYDHYRKNMDIRNIKPNITHNYLKKLEDSGKLKMIVTQNIDGLHQKAGSNKVLAIHGSPKCYCMNCGVSYEEDYIFKTTDIPKCKCGGLIRPDVVLYGEMLKEEFGYAQYYISKADLLIVAGTSLTVEPASSMIKLYQGKKLVILNLDKTPYDKEAKLVIHDKLGNIFSKLKV